MKQDFSHGVADQPQDRGPESQGRRAALLRLGLAVGAAYTAPTLLKLDRSAEAAPKSCVGNGKKVC